MPAQKKKKTERLKDFTDVLHFYGPFSSDTMAVKWLTANIIIRTDGKVVSLVVSVTTGEVPEPYFIVGVKLRHF